jgi:hypothetical protein
MQQSAAFDSKSQPGTNSITLFRNMIVGKTIFADTDYSELRGFYAKVEAKDQETLVITRAPAAAAAKSGGE